MVAFRVLLRDILGKVLVSRVMDDEECDKYGNPINGDRLIYCCFPDCGCDGSRLCMAEKGASGLSFDVNLENMYNRSDVKAKVAKATLYGLCFIDRERKG